MYWGVFGDLIVTLPFLGYLRRGFPKAKIVYLVGGRGEKPRGFGHASLVLENHPFVDKYIKSTPSIIKEILKDEPYDLVIDLCDTRFSGTLSHLSGARVRIWGKFREMPTKFSLTKRLGSGKWSAPLKKITIKKELCRTEQFLAIIRSLGVKTKAKIMPKIYLTREEKRFSLLFFKKFSRKRNFIVGIHPGGRVPHRLWDTKNYSLLADKLIEELNAKVIVFYAPGEEKFADKVCRRSRYKLNKVLQKDTRKYMSLIWGCQVLITSDGGPLHIALALGVPCVGMFDNKYNAPYWYDCYPKEMLFPLHIDNYSLKQNKKEVAEVFKRAKFILQSRLKNRCGMIFE